MAKLENLKILISDIRTGSMQLETKAFTRLYVQTIAENQHMINDKRYSKAFIKQLDRLDKKLRRTTCAKTLINARAYKLIDSEEGKIYDYRAD